MHPVNLPLGIIHFSKHRTAPCVERLNWSTRLNDAFFLETCQRLLWVFPASPVFSENLPLHAELLTGPHAYAFLLRTACGLESKISGETEIFGQLKIAWQEYSKKKHSFQIFLSSWFQRLFEDTKEIRARCLQNLGSNSYGGLIRKLIRTRSINPSLEPVLVVGAGQVAQSILPWLAEHEIWLWNRGPRGLTDVKTPFRRLQRQEESYGFKNAAHAVICIPIDPEGDSRRIRLWTERASAGRTLIHLGTERSHGGAWNGLKNFYALDEVYALQTNQESLRANQMMLAKKACEEKAFLRSLPGARSSPFELAHGWEDLPAFF